MGDVPARTLSFQEGWIVRSLIGWRGERSILYKDVEISPQQMCFKNLEEKLGREGPKRIIFASGELEFLWNANDYCFNSTFTLEHPASREGGKWKPE